MNHKIIFEAPVKGPDGRHILAAEIDFASGDAVRLEAMVTADSAERMMKYGMQAAQYGMRTANNLMKWAKNNVELRGDWQGYGMIGKAVAGVVEKTANHPLMNLPMLTEEGKDKHHPGYQYARELLVKDGYHGFERLRDMYLRNTTRQDVAEVMAGACYLGNCCCGKKRMKSCYDVSYLIDHPYAIPHHTIACALADEQMLRSWRAIFGGEEH